VMFAPSQFPWRKETNLKIVNLLEEKGIPFVLLGAIFREAANRYSFVGSNGFSATREVVQHLVGVGHRRIAYIRGFAGNFSSDERYFGFLTQMKQEGLEVPEGYVRAIEEGPIEGQARQELREILSRTPRPTAVICGHDALAKNVIDEAKKMGLRVPEDLGVVGFDDVYYAKTLDPPLTTVRVPVVEEGKLAADMLFAKINGEMTGERQEFLNCELIVRRSCGANISESAAADETSMINNKLFEKTVGTRL
jgi:DNA-binding LacI/PurR family transcriptional regulator